MQVRGEKLKLVSGDFRSWIVLLAMGLVLLASLGALAAMDPAIRRTVVDLLGYGGTHSDEPSGSRDLFHRDVDIGGLKNGETYAAYDKRRQSTVADGFSGFGCIDSCATHNEGFRWAEANKVTAEKQCQGSSWASLEGCAAYVGSLSPRR